jgi:hypothetical protein
MINQLFGQVIVDDMTYSNWRDQGVTEVFSAGEWDIIHLKKLFYIRLNG